LVLEIVYLGVSNCQPTRHREGHNPKQAPH
jgi:hypothetical protein